MDARTMSMLLCGRHLNTLCTNRFSSRFHVYKTTYSNRVHKLICRPCSNNKPQTVASLHGHYGGSFWNPSRSHRYQLHVLKTPFTFDQTRRASFNNSAEENVHKTLPTDVQGFKHVYTGPLKGAVRAIKIFSLFTCIAAVTSAPVLVLFGKASVSLMARVVMTTIVMTVGVGTTALLHWLLKGYILQMHYNSETQMARIQTLSIAGTRKTTEFHISESGPPPSVGGFSSFQAKGKSYFLHTDVFKDKKVLSGLLGSFMGLEQREITSKK